VKEIINGTPPPEELPSQGVTTSEKPQEAGKEEKSLIRKLK